MASDYTENGKGLLQLKIKINKPVLNAPLQLAPSVTSPPFPSTFQLSPLMWDSVGCWFSYSVPSGELRGWKATAQDMFGGLRQNLLALSSLAGCFPGVLRHPSSPWGYPRVFSCKLFPHAGETIAEFAICRNYTASLLTSFIHFVLLISLLHQTSSFWHWDSWLQSGCCLNFHLL